MPEKIWSECNHCKCSTRHEILHKHSFESNPQEYHYEVIHMLIQCLGCETVSFRKESHDYEAHYQVAEDEWEHDTTIDIYPHFIEGHNGLEKIWGIPNIVQSVYKESILAIQEGAFTLAGLGLRATIEAICNEQDIKGKDLQKRINAMVREGLISKKDANRLHSIRFMGNDAAHDIKKAKKASVLIALKIVEHLITTVYILDSEVKSHLETTISSFDEMLNVLKENIKSFNDGEIITFVKLLGKDRRRIIENNQLLENEFETYVSDGKFENVILVEIPNEDGSTTKNYKISIPQEEDEEIVDIDL